jgi:hypothetical protein
MDSLVVRLSETNTTQFLVSDAGCSWIFQQGQAGATSLTRHIGSFRVECQKKITPFGVPTQCGNPSHTSSS